MCENHLSAAESAPDLEPAIDPTVAPHPLLGRRTLLLGAASVGIGVAGAGLVGQLPAAAAAKSQNGWPVLSSSSKYLNRGFRAGGVTYPGGVRRGDAAVILRYVARRFDSEVENLRAGWCWGYAYKKIGGGTTWSNHASATALDLNAPEHPLGAEGTFSKKQVKVIRAILNYCGGVVRWGGDYRGTRDEMHFELNVGPKNPRVKALVGKIRG